jgi:Uma2 family endonuclease
MPTLIVDQHLEKRLRTERIASGADRYDEVWETIYVISPMPDDEHQQLVNRLASIFQDAIDWPGKGDVRPGVNVSDRMENWRENYRVPDVAVFLKDGQASNCGEFWHGGPDFAVEIVSSGDRTRDKLEFYAKVGVRELLVVDRQPWSLELLRLDAAQLVPVGCSREGGQEALSSEVLPFVFQLQPGRQRPHIAVTHTATGRIWLV